MLFSAAATTYHKSFIFTFLASAKCIQSHPLLSQNLKTSHSLVGLLLEQDCLPRAIYISRESVISLIFYL